MGLRGVQLSQYPTARWLCNRGLCRRSSRGIRQNPTLGSFETVSRELSTRRIFAMWLAFGLGLGLLAGAQVFIGTGGKVLRSLVLVGFGLLIGLIIAMIYAVLLRK